LWLRNLAVFCPSLCTPMTFQRIFTMTWQMPKLEREMSLHLSTSFVFNDFVCFV
jgi:hypothetical protein